MRPGVTTPESYRPMAVKIVWPSGMPKRPSIHPVVLKVGGGPLSQVPKPVPLLGITLAKLRGTRMYVPTPKLLPTPPSSRLRS